MSQPEKKLSNNFTRAVLCAKERFDRVSRENSRISKSAVLASRSELSQSVSPHSGLGQLGDGELGVLDAVRGLVRVHHAQEQHTVNVQRHVVCRRPESVSSLPSDRTEANTTDALFERLRLGRRRWGRGRISSPGMLETRYYINCKISERMLKPIEKFF